jgi:hypothetical protein
MEITTRFKARLSKQATFLDHLQHDQSKGSPLRRASRVSSWHPGKEEADKAIAELKECGRRWE